MVEEGVPHPGHRALAGPGQVHAGGVVGKPRQGGEGQGGQGAEDDVLPQRLPAADALNPAHQKAREVEGLAVDDGVHRHPDDLGGHVVCHHRHHHHEEGREEPSPEPLGIGEKPEDAGLFLGLHGNAPPPGERPAAPRQTYAHCSTPSGKSQSPAPGSVAVRARRVPARGRKIPPLRGAPEFWAGLPSLSGTTLLPAAWAGFARPTPVSPAVLDSFEKPTPCPSRAHSKVIYSTSQAREGDVNL